MGACVVWGRRRSTRERLVDLLARGRVEGLPAFDRLVPAATPQEVRACGRADLVVVGVEHDDPAHTWLEVLRVVRRADPAPPVVVVGPGVDAAAPDPASHPAVLALAHGARGYLRAVPDADQGAPDVLTPARPASPELSPRETDVLLGMTEGQSNAEIAASLVLAEDTVKTHARRLFRKLGAGDRADAVARGFRQGLIR